ncbi:MAG TPA: hypothetical protein VM285_06580 [Polyangia bacterium]|nr:hypothetical protein [Polyangia bacterium]
MAKAYLGGRCVTRDADGTRFAPSLISAAAKAVSGQRCATGEAISSASEVPLRSEPASFCLRFLPGPRRTCFRVQIIDLDTGEVLDEPPPQALGELPGVLARMAGWVSRR